MQVTIKTTVSPTAWDELALVCEGSYFHTHAYALFEANKAHLQPLFISLFNGERCCGVAVATIETPHYWPLSAYCKKATFGALPAVVDAEQIPIFMSLIEQALKRRGVFQVFHHAYASKNAERTLTGLSYKLIERHEFHLSLYEDQETIWMNFDGSLRRNIRKAEKNNVTSEMATSLDAVIATKSLQVSALERKSVIARGQVEAVSQRIKSVLIDEQRAMIALSFLNDEPLAGALYGFFNKQVYYVISGSSLAGNQLSAPAHMIWQAICYFKEKGCHSFNLGGVSAEEAKQQAGLFRFKKKFGGQIIAQPAGEKNIAYIGHFLDCCIKTIKRIVR